MDWIVLNGHVPNNFEFFDPANDFLDHISDNDEVTVCFLDLPASRSADFSLFFGLFKGLEDGITMSADPNLKAVSDFGWLSMKCLTP